MVQRDPPGGLAVTAKQPGLSPPNDQPPTESPQTPRQAQQESAKAVDRPLNIFERNKIRGTGNDADQGNIKGYKDLFPERGGYTVNNFQDNPISGNNNKRRQGNLE